MYLKLGTSWELLYTLWAPEFHFSNLPLSHVGISARKRSRTNSRLSATSYRFFLCPPKEFHHSSDCVAWAQSAVEFNRWRSLQSWIQGRCNDICFSGNRFSLYWRLPTGMWYIDVLFCSFRFSKTLSLMSPQVSNTAWRPWHNEQTNLTHKNNPHTYTTLVGWVGGWLSRRKQSISIAKEITVQYFWVMLVCWKSVTQVAPIFVRGTKVQIKECWGLMVHEKYRISLRCY